jgi:repressor of nif and glnA expression
MYEVLRIIAELQNKQEVVYTGLIKKEIRKRGLAISERSLDYYLNNLESKGLIELKYVRKDKGRTREIKLKLPIE